MRPVETPEGNVVPAGILGVYTTGDGLRAEMELEWDSERAHHVLRRLTFSGDAITSADIRIPLDALVASCITMTTRYAAEPPPWGEAFAETERRQKRRQVTPARLAEVAEEWHASGGSIQRIRDRFYVGRAQAYRLVGAARDAGLIKEGEA